jgi:hypothetical protein
MRKDYRWSSARAHCEIDADPLVDPDWPSVERGAVWQNWLRDDGDNERVDRLIRESTFAGRPCGNEEFVRRVGSTLRRSFGKKKPGPKPKDTSKTATLWTPEENRS